VRSATASRATLIPAMSNASVPLGSWTSLPKFALWSVPTAPPAMPLLEPMSWSVETPVTTHSHSSLIAAVAP
jgi:hypothetical protein